MSTQQNPDPRDDAGDSHQAGGLLDGYLTRPELCKELKIGERTMANYDAMGEGPPRRFLAGRWIYRKDLAREWLNSALTTEPGQ